MALQAIVQPRVLVVCRRQAGETYGQLRLARYEWSASEGVWERIDRHGSDNDWHIRHTPDGLQAHPPHFLPVPAVRGQEDGV